MPTIDNFNGIKLLKQFKVDKNSPAYILFESNEFAKVELAGNTLSWSNVEQFISMRDGKKMKVPYEIGADVLLKFSQPEKSEPSLKLGKMIREERLKNGLTQQELALKSGTSRTYISRIENDRSDLEIATLRKIIETGLGKRLEIQIK